MKLLKEKKQRDSVERNKQQKKTSSVRNRQRTPSESESDDESGEDNSSEILAECGLVSQINEINMIHPFNRKTSTWKCSVFYSKKQSPVN